MWQSLISMKRYAAIAALIPIRRELRSPYPKGSLVLGQEGCFLAGGGAVAVMPPRSRNAAPWIATGWTVRPRSGESAAYRDELHQRSLFSGGVRSVVLGSSEFACEHRRR